MRRREFIGLASATCLSVSAFAVRAQRAVPARVAFLGLILRYDPLFQRHASRVRAEMESFRPDVVHITGLNDVSIMGAT